MTTTVPALTVLTVLVCSGVVHAVRHGDFRGAIGEQSFVPAAVVSIVAAATTIAEIAIGAAGLAVVAVAGGAAVRAVAIAAAGLSLAFAVYSAALVRRGTAVPCGCSASDYPVNVWVPVRAGVLAVAALWAAAWGGDALVGSPPAEVAVIVLAAASFSALLWFLPDALADPLELPFVRSALGVR